MGRRDRELFQNIEIETVAAEGKSLAHVNGKVIFVPFAVPGDVVDIQVKIKRKGYMEGYVTNMIKPSPDRIEPFCSHFGVCGGCKWQSLPYSTQLQFKQQQVTDQLTRIGHLKLPEITPILGSENEQYYRNKLEFTFSSKRWIESLTEAENLPAEQRTGLGFHIAGLFDKVLDIEHCYLQPSPSNEIRLFVKQFAMKNGYTFFDLREQTGFLRTMVIRTSTTGEVMVIVVFANENKEDRERLLDALKENFPAITSLNWIINGKKNDSIADLDCSNYSGMPYITEKMEELTFRIGPKSFYQTNSHQAYRLYSIVRDFAELKGDEILYDLYTGTGTIALFLAKGASKVVGIEYVPEAIEDAKINAAENNIQNCSFFAGDMKDMLSPQFIEQNGKPNVVILDPPRAGIHPDVAKVLAEAAPEKIVYVSCNPATQARDIALLGDNYEIKRVQPVDMFPHTHHLENVVLLVKKG
ncbi:MAG: 23S rRNA (uracil(1939)-C(5))-methyltransferase RlmD [Bacteroidetes bacterium HGW-Bacteroidetes-7]|jgi:23S rRNA (uracil1939-C5)-methyltransferase|nr:MAG: 23S rRNA (uracil(1939)-C(5))-methyltransferase RlmD [Bacteroidetes bacterium HGW-Bacteroidetes-7]